MAHLALCHVGGAEPEDRPETAGGPCIAVVQNEQGEDELCGCTLASCWYGKGMLEAQVGVED